MMSIHSVFLRAFFAASFFIPAFGATPQYTAVDLGGLSGGITQAAAVNDAGQVAGNSATTGGSNHAFLYSGGGMIDLGTLGGKSSFALGINALGQLVGQAYLVGDAAFHGFRYSGGSMTDLGTFGGTLSIALGINASAEVVGYAFFPGDTVAHAFLYNNGTLTDLGGGTLMAQGIIDAGQVTGSISGGDGFHAFLYNAGSVRDLGTLGGTQSHATAINNSGQVVGQSDTTGNAAMHAFLYSGGSMIDLGSFTPGGMTGALSINDAGQVVGQELDNNVGRAFVYRGGVIGDLNSLVSLATTLYTANGINNSGQIVANGTNGHAYLLTPITPIQPPLTMTGPVSLHDGTIAVLYAPVQFVAAGGAGGNHWSAVGLPSGLAIDSTTGVLSGTPTQFGLFNPRFTVMDANSATVNVTLALTISPPPLPPPAITSVSSVLGINAKQTLFINGSGFADGPSIHVAVTWPGGQANLPVNLITSTQLSLSFNFSIASGDWTAQVINGDGQPSNIAFFSVSTPGSGTTTHLAVPQFTFSGAWYSAIYLSNTTSVAASVQVTFTDDNAAPLPVPLVGIGTVTSRTVNLPAGTTVVLEALNDPANPQIEGSADVALPPGVIGYVVFRQVVPGRANQEALVPFTPVSSQSADFTYDEILFTTATAFLNPSDQQVNVTVTAYGPDGAQVGNTQIALAPHAKSTDALKSYPGMSGVVGKQGRVVVSVANGAVSALVLRFGGSAFTDVPVNYR